MLTFTALALASTALLCGTTTEAKSIPRRNLPWNSNPLKAKTALLSRNTIPESFINATRGDPSTVALHIDTSDLSARNDTAPYLYGLMHEDINVCYNMSPCGESIRPLTNSSGSTLETVAYMENCLRTAPSKVGYVTSPCTSRANSLKDPMSSMAPCPNSVEALSSVPKIQLSLGTR